MPYDDVQKFSEAAVNKAKLLKEHPGKYFLRAVMAGFFIVVAMIFSNVVGNTFQSTDPAWGKLLGGIVFDANRNMIKVLRSRIKYDTINLQKK